MTDSNQDKPFEGEVVYRPDRFGYALQELIEDCEDPWPNLIKLVANRYPKYHHRVWLTGRGIDNYWYGIHLDTMDKYDTDFTKLKVTKDDLINAIHKSRLNIEINKSLNCEHELWKENEDKFYNEVLAHNYEEDLPPIDSMLYEFGDEHPDPLTEDNFEQYKADILVGVNKVMDSIRQSWLDRNVRLGYTHK
jgi:hypothetical protein